MLCSSYHHKPSRISHPCRIDIHIVLHYSSLTSTSPWFFSLLCHKCLEVNHPSFSLQFRWWLLNTVIVWLLEKYYWFCVTFSVFCFFLLFPLSTNCFSVVPLQLKMQSTLVLVTLPMKKLCLYLSLSLYSLYTITVVVLFLVELLAKHPYLGVIHCCTWNDHWAQIPLFFSSTTTTISSVPYSLSLRLTNHVAKSYFLLLQPSN